jgi:hypothetical protein
MTLDEAVFKAEELGRAIQKADEEFRWDDRKALRTEWVELLETFRGGEEFYTLYYAHWDAQDEYKSGEKKRIVPGAA